MDPAEIRATADAVARDPDFWLDPTNEYVWLEGLDRWRVADPARAATTPDHLTGRRRRTPRR